MEMFNFQLTETAKADIEAVGKYIAENFYIETAISLVDDIGVKIEEICETPLIFEVKTYSDNYGAIRIAVVKNYNIYFALDESINMIYIVRVAHCSMNLVQNFIDGDT